MKQFIECPNCGAIELATIEETIPFWTYIHDCKCGYTIMESEWNAIKGHIDETVLDRAIEKWGIDAQCEMIIEECIELALALQKMKRTRGNREDKLMAVIDEIADVKIMIRQAQKIFNSDIINDRVDFKMNRLSERLNEIKPVPWKS